MKVSIVTPSFNSAATSEETIRSVLDQQGAQVEYIVVDGGSTDGTADIIRRHGPRLAWWVSETDRGQVDALNKGCARSTGEVLGFLNADDVLMPGALGKVTAAFVADPASNIVSGALEWIDAAGSPLGMHRGDISTLEDILDIFRVWWGGRQWVQPEVFFRRTLKERVGAFDERYHLAFDYDFWVRCFRTGARVTRLADTLVKFRRHAAQKSIDTERAVNEIRTVLAEHLAACPDISGWTRRRLSAELEYDIYQSGKIPGESEARAPFAAALLQHPAWLLAAPARQRIIASFRKRLRVTHRH